MEIWACWCSTIFSSIENLLKSPILCFLLMFVLTLKDVKIFIVDLFASKSDMKYFYSTYGVINRHLDALYRLNLTIAITFFYWSDVVLVTNICQVWLPAGLSLNLLQKNNLNPTKFWSVQISNISDTWSYFNLFQHVWRQGTVIFRHVTQWNIYFFFYWTNFEVDIFWDKFHPSFRALLWHLHHFLLFTGHVYLNTNPKITPE